MTVYVDNALIEATVPNGTRSIHGRWCHLTADTRVELDAMADRIGLRRAWIQYPGTWKEHYDVTERKRHAAVLAGAIEVDYREHTARFLRARRELSRDHMPAPQQVAAGIRARVRTRLSDGRLVPPTSFVAIDFETCMAKRASPIQIGVVRVIDGVIGQTNTSPVLPPAGFRVFEPGARRIHGLTEDYIVGAPEWPDILQRLVRIATTADGVLLPLVAHNAGFERSVITQTSREVGVPVPPFAYFDTVRYAREVVPEAPNHKLNTLVDHLGLGPFRHHDAGEDAAVTAQLLLTLAKRSRG